MGLKILIDLFGGFVQELYVGLLEFDDAELLGVG